MNIALKQLLRFRLVRNNGEGALSIARQTQVEVIRFDGKLRIKEKA